LHRFSDRDGDLYALDPHDAETDLWAFRLGLRPLPIVARDPGPLPSLDEGKRELETRIGAELTDIGEKLSSYDSIAAVDVRALLRALDFDPGPRRLAELGPPQKSVRLNRRGRMLKITTTLLIQGSCGIHQPFGDPATLRGFRARHGTSSSRAWSFRRHAVVGGSAEQRFALHGRSAGSIRSRKRRTRRR
jgi:hypothetical protein